MNITASGYIDERSIKALNHLSFGKRKPINKLIFYIVFAASLIAFSITGLILWGYNTLITVIMICDIIIILVVLYLYFLFPKLQIKASGNILGAVNRFEFRKNGFSVSTVFKNINENSNCGYNIFNNMNPVRTMKFERKSRIADGHKVTVSYTYRLTV